MALYYIKQTGNDSAAGTSWATAWQTLDHLVTADPLDNGDTVIIRPGVASAPYYPLVSIRWWNSHITFISEDRAVALGIIAEDGGHLHGKPIIDGTNIASSTLDIFRPDIHGIVKPGGPWDCHGVILDGLTLKNAKGSAFWAAMDITYDRATNRDHAIRNCLIDTSFSSGIFVSRADYFTLEQSELKNCGTDPTRYNLNHPMYICRSDFPTIQDNIVHDSPGRYGVYVNGSMTDNVQEFIVEPTIRRNTCYNCMGNGIGVYNAVGGRVENNLIYDTLFMFQSSDGGIRIGIQDDVPNAVPSNGVVVTCNTIIESLPNTRGVILIHKPEGGPNDIGSANCYVFDNTILTATGTPAQAVEYNTAGNHTVESNFIAPYTTPNLTNWFTNYAAKDFHPKAAAPWIDTGEESAYNSAWGRKLAPTTDFDGAARPQGRHTEPGCFEYPSGALDYVARITAVQATLTHSETPTMPVLVAPLQTFVIPDWRIDVSSWGGTFKDTIQKASGYNAMVKLEFELLRDGGCGDATIELMRERVPGPPRAAQFGYKIAPGDVIDIYLHSWYFGDITTKWYQGVVTKMDDPEGFGETITIKAEGLWKFLSKRLVTKYYEGKAINLMVADILADVYAESRLSSGASGISITYPYTISDVEFELTSFSDAIAALAAVQLNVQYGIDQNGLLYFRDISTTTMLTKQVGINVSSYEKYAEADDLTNHYLLQAKQLVGGANLILSKESAASITSYGRRTKVLPVTGLQNLSDLARYGTSLLDETDEPNTHVELDVVGDVYYLFPRGNCKIVKLDRTVMDLPIRSVKYTFAGNATMKLGLGDAPENSLSEEIRRMTRQVTVGKQSSMSNTKIEHTKNEEWAQSVRIDAGKQGNLTLYYDVFDSARGLDPASRGYLHDTTIGCMRNRLPPGTMPYTDMYSIPIDIGAVVGTVRAHLWIDQLGIVEFKSSDVLREYFSDANNSWTCETVGLVSSSRTDKILWEYEAQQPGPAYTIHAWVTSGAIDDAGHYQDIIFNYADDNNYGGLRFVHAAANVWKAKLFKYVSAAYSDVAWAEMTVAPVKVEVDVRNSPTDTTARVYDTYGNVIATVVLAVPGYTAGSSTLRTWGFVGWDNPAGMYVTKAGWVELGGAFNVYVKRNTGTGWVTAVSGLVTDGEVNVDVDVSSQATGTTIQMRCYMRGNMALKGWGWSAKTT